MYAISTHPNIKNEELSEKKFVLGGVPTLVEFENHKVINFYFDDKFQYPWKGLLCIICIMSFLCVIIPNIFLHKMERNSLIDRINREGD